MLIHHQGLMLLLVPEPVCPLLTDPLRLSLRAAKRRDGTSARCHPSTAPAAGSLSAAGTAEQAEPAAGHGDTRSHCAAEELSSKLLVLPGFLVPLAAHSQLAAALQPGPVSHRMCCAAPGEDNGSAT